MPATRGGKNLNIAVDAEVTADRKQGILALRQQIRDTLAPFVRGHRECALVGFPDHSNVGDSAIWLGQLAWLQDAGIRVAYRCHERSYDPEILRRSSPNGLIVLAGGGNLGDLWPRLQQLRERVIEDFPGRSILQLPQSIHFRNRDTLTQARAVFHRHPGLTIVVRDDASLGVARAGLDVKTVLCPDMAFYLGPLSLPRVPDRDVLWLRRTDVEGLPDAAPVADGTMLVTDWLDPRLPALRRVRDAIEPLALRHPRRLALVRRLAEATLDAQARQRLQIGCALLARGKVVVTDRLHAHILSVLLGIPHVILDNSYGKLRHFYETWTRSMPQVRRAESPAEAAAAAEELMACAC
jgi:pyruvyl transferase EpsO